MEGAAQAGAGAGVAPAPDEGHDWTGQGVAWNGVLFRALGEEGVGGSGRQAGAAAGARVGRGAMRCALCPRHRRQTPPSPLVPARAVGAGQTPPSSTTDSGEAAAGASGGKRQVQRSRTSAPGAPVQCQVRCGGRLQRGKPIADTTPSACFSLTAGCTAHTHGPDRGVHRHRGPAPGPWHCGKRGARPCGVPPSTPPDDYAGAAAGRAGPRLLRGPEQGQSLLQEALHLQVRPQQGQWSRRNLCGRCGVLPALVGTV